MQVKTGVVQAADTCSGCITMYQVPGQNVLFAQTEREREVT